MPYPYQPFEEKTVDEIKNRQWKIMEDHIAYTYNNSPYHKDLFDREGLKPESFKSFDDLRRIPVTTKQNLRDKNPLFYAAPESEWVDINTTSGTTGKPVYMPETRKDIKRVAVGGAQTLRLSGINETDRVHLAMPMSAWLWAAGFGFYFCFATAGAMVLRFGPGYTEKSLLTMQNMKATALMAVPSFAVKMGLENKQMGLDIPLKRIFTIGENVLEKDLSHNSLGRKIKELWPGTDVFSCYGATEGPILCVECNKHCGHHINPYEAYIEILDPDTLEPVPDGEEGLVAVTPLSVEGFPLLRYINGDLSFLNPERCPCERMMQTIGPIFARNDHMMKIKGVKVYPEAIREVVSGEGLGDLIQVEAYTEKYMDQLLVYVPLPANEADPEQVALSLQDKIRRTLGVTLYVKAIPPEELRMKVMPPEKRKPVVFVDNRDKR